MATVVRRPKTRFWHAIWRDASGRLRMRSTRLTNRAKAMRLALEYERIDRELRRGRMAVRQAQQVVADLARELGLETEPVPTIRAWLDGWLKERRERVKDSTFVNYEKACHDLLTFLGAEADRPLPSLTTARLQEWVSTLTGRGLAPGTVRVYFEPIRAASTRAWKRGYVTSDIAADIELPRVVHASKDGFTTGEIDALLAVADPEWRLVVLAGAYAGLRLSDAARLTWESVDLAAGVLRLVVGKTSRPIVIPLHPRLRSELEERAGDDPRAPLCPSLRDRATSGSRGLSALFKHLMREAGVAGEQRGSGRRKVSSKSAHSLRHTFIRRLMSAGVDQAVRMKLAGHTTGAAHQVYAQAEIEQLRRAVEALP